MVNTKKIKKMWFSRITAEKKKHKVFRDRAKKAVEVYENDIDGSINGDDNKEVDFPIMRNVVDVQLGALTSKMPQAKISKRFEYNNQSKLCSKIEKAVNYLIEKSTMQSEVYQSAEDFLTAGLGGMRVIYDATFKQEEITQIIPDEFGNQIEVQTGEFNEVLESEKLNIERFEWSNFGWQPCKRWNDCDWIYFRSTFTVSEFKRKYKISPSAVNEDNEKDTISVYEIWDKNKKTRIVISDAHDSVLEQDDNPLGTEYFYPCAEPMFFALADDELTPCPELHFWKKLHDKINKLAKREDSLTDSIKDIEFYDGLAFKDLSKVENAEDGTKVPVDLQRYQSGSQPSINNAVSPKDNSSPLSVLQVVTSRLDDNLSKAYQTTGIGDIMQATSDPNETATAQNLKHSWGSSRLSSKRFCIENHIRGTIEITTNVMVKLFQPESIMIAAGERLTPEEIQELQETDEYRIDVETLSTLSIDKDRDQQNSVELLNAITALFAQSQQIPQPLILALLNNVVKTFVSGNELQETIQQLPDYFNQLQQAQQAAQQVQQQMQELQGQMQQIQAQNQAMAQELNRYDQAKQGKDIAETAKKNAETRKIEVDTVQKANEMLVQQNALIDEALALQPIGQEQIPVQL